MIIPVSNVGELGIVVDPPYEKLPLNAWTSGRNVRFRDGAVEKFSGHSQVYGAPTWAPYWIMPVYTSLNNFWLYASLTKVGATDGASHADITRAAGGDYGTDANIGWTGTVFQGIAVITNGVDVPQMWNPPALATDLVALTAWPGTAKANVMKALKRYLVAMDITKGATRYPFTIKWSDRAGPNAVPLSWDEMNETTDAGEFELPSDGGFIVDSFPLRDYLMVYKEYETWLMQFIGGTDIFAFNRKFGFGMLSRRCAAEFMYGQHFVFTGDDIVIHDSQQAKSLLDGRAKKLLSGRIDSSNYRKSFVVSNPNTKEAWACFPEPGQTYPNKALVWNWREGTLGIRDLPNAAFIAPGIVDPVAADELWSGAVGDWTAETAAWGDRAFDPIERKLLMAVPGVNKLYQPDSTQQFDGVNMTSYVEREALGFPLKIGEPPDFTSVKQLNYIWPKISGTAGNVINVYVGTQNEIDGPVTWASPRAFRIGTDRFLDFTLTGRMHALRFESTGDFEWKLRGYDVDVVKVSDY